MLATVQPPRVGNEGQFQAERCGFPMVPIFFHMLPPKQLVHITPLLFAVAWALAPSEAWTGALNLAPRNRNQASLQDPLRAPQGLLGPELGPMFQV